MAAQAASMSNTGAQVGCLLVVAAMPALGGASKAHQWDPCTPSPTSLPVRGSRRTNMLERYSDAGARARLPRSAAQAHIDYKIGRCGPLFHMRARAPRWGRPAPWVPLPTGAATP